ncbi:MAG: 30S ribosomal protein S8 [Candidatus Diapherotrites archaeon]|nr:30S ribosomal protein S8 [Candidatus Diapherotrites archaeon]
MSMDPIADGLINLKNQESAAKKQCSVRPASKLLGEIFRVMQETGFITAYEFVEDQREGTYKVKIGGKINSCKAIKPRYAVKKDGFEKYEKRYLPAKDVGLLIVSTPKGVMSHIQAKKQNIGGRLLAYVY